MNYYIGLDGGGSKTKCVLCDTSLKILSEAKTETSNFLIAGSEKTAFSIIDLIAECCLRKGISVDAVSGIVLGTTGAGRKSDAEKLQDAILTVADSKNIRINFFKVESDARIALEGAFSGNPGSILIAGTGSIMFGKDRNGIIHRVGGLGRLIGDEGSGLTLGKKGLNLLAKYYDGRIKSTKLKSKIENKFRIENQSMIISKVYNEEIKVQDVAPLVISAADEGDELCYEILDHETDELIVHINAMNNKLNEEKMRIAFIGGLISNTNTYSDLLKKKINLYFPKIIIQRPDFPPEIGAVIMAKEVKK